MVYSKSSVKLTDSKYSHMHSDLGSYNGLPFVTGGYKDNIKTELMKDHDMIWRWRSAWYRVDDYPFCDECDE